MNIGPPLFQQTAGIDQHAPPLAEAAADMHAAIPAPIGNASRNASLNAHLANLALLPRSLLGRITDEFPLGSRCPARLTAVNRSLREKMSSRAEADRLTALASNPSIVVDRAAFFTEIIAAARLLSPDLRYPLLAHVASVLPKNLNTPANLQMHQVFQALQAAMHEIPDPYRRYVLLHALALEFCTPAFRENYCNIENYAFSRVSMEAMFRHFNTDLMNFAMENASVLRHVPRSHPYWNESGGQSNPINDGRINTSPVPPVSIVAETLSVSARSLYLIENSTLRNNIWKEIFHDVRSGTAEDRKTLVVALSDAIGDLGDQAHREAACAAILQCVPDTPVAFLPVILNHLGTHLVGLGNVACRTNFLALRDIAASLPPKHQATCLSYLLVVPDTRLDGDRHSLTRAALDCAQQLPAAECSALLGKLASLIPHLPEAEHRLQHFDAIWQVAIRMDAKQALRPIVLLTATIPDLPSSGAQHMRFNASLDFITESLLPAISANEAVLTMYSLIDAAFQVHDAAMQVAFVRDALSVVAQQPSSQQVSLLNYMYSWLKNAPPVLLASTASAASRIVRRLPPSDQVPVLSRATYVAVRMDRTNSMFHLKQITALCNALPQSVQQAAWQEMIAGFEKMLVSLQIWARGTSNPALQEMHRSLLDGTVLLPMDVRFNVLASAVDALDTLNPGVFPTARQDTHAQIATLPASMQAALLTP